MPCNEKMAFLSIPYKFTVNFTVNARLQLAEGEFCRFDIIFRDFGGLLGAGAPSRPPARPGLALALGLGAGVGQGPGQRVSH